LEYAKLVSILRNLRGNSGQRRLAAVLQSLAYGRLAHWRLRSGRDNVGKSHAACYRLC